MQWYMAGIVDIVVSVAAVAGSSSVHDVGVTVSHDVGVTVFFVSLGTFTQATPTKTTTTNVEEQCEEIQLLLMLFVYVWH